jgi:hypothetical protein
MQSMRRRWLAALAGAGLLIAGCSRLTAPRPTLGTSASPDPPSSAARPVALAPPTGTAVGASGVRLSDLPVGWVVATGRPPTSLTSVLPRLAACLDVKLAAITGEALRQPGPAYRSADSKEWLTASTGGALTPQGTSLPPAPSSRLRGCVAAAVVGDLTGSGFGSVRVQAVSATAGLSSIVAHSLDVRVSTSLTVFGLAGAVFVDLVWITNHRAAAVFDVVNQAFHGDLQGSDEGLIALAVDAAGRRISGL